MTRRRTKAEVRPEAGNVLERTLDRVLQSPRSARMMIVIGITLATAALVFPAVDYNYLTYWFDFDTRNVPALVTAGIAIAAYVLGWFVLLRASEGRPPSRAAARLYLIVGSLVILATALLIIYGMVSALIQ